MKKIEILDLAKLMGGAFITPANNCTALQNEANAEGSSWSNEQWEKWINEYQAAGCLHG